MFFKGESMMSDNRLAYVFSVGALVVFFSLSCPQGVASARLRVDLDASMGYLFVSEAEGTPWFFNTAFPSAAIDLGGDVWAMGVSVDYARNNSSYRGYFPGYTDSLEVVEKRLSNASMKLFAKIFPGGRDNIVSPYLGLGVGPALTSIEHRGKSTDRKKTDSAIRVSYSVSVGSRVRLGDLPLSAFLEGSFGGLGALAASDEKEPAAVPSRGFDFVAVTAGLGVTFR